MPDFGYKCPDCKRRFRKVVPVANRDIVACPSCGALAERRFEPPSVRVVTPFKYPYHDVALGKRIESAQHHKRVMREMGVEHKR